jgi:hypothetical protein
MEDGCSSSSGNISELVGRGGGGKSRELVTVVSVDATVVEEGGTGSNRWLLEVLIAPRSTEAVSFKLERSRLLIFI